jgi:hypothetical protein
MRTPTYLKPVLIATAAVVALGLLRYQPWQRGSTTRSAPQATETRRAVLKVGFLPVT